MRVEIVGKNDCSWCEKAVNLMESIGFPYVYREYGSSITKEELLERVPDVKTVPVIFIDGYHVGGYADLEIIHEDLARYNIFQNMFEQGSLFEVEFEKSDGSMRIMKATLDPSRIPPVDISEETYPKKVSKPRKPVLTALRVFDVEAKDWRSFNLSKVKNIREIHD